MLQNLPDILLVTCISLGGALTFLLGIVLGYSLSKPKRDSKGRFKGNKKKRVFVDGDDYSLFPKR